ncbi:uncharacterized protein LTR77_000155 [Saxophila tyrrhenica]|uniref:Uncharacterized protein n=1 Tax=Saxophila tyrrhenica TaxID=1690608 RepID=A0AAV9PM78_9PEZI|nr:hypothetical protein LTR77_000155 [Saxophila tyrrhenica]
MAENTNPPPSSYVPPPPSGSNGTSKHSRVTSTVAQSFADDLDSMFGLGMGGSSVRTTEGAAPAAEGSGNGEGLNTLSETVEAKKEKVTSGQTELEKLEARLRETEQRLAKVSRQNSPSRPANGGAASDGSDKQAHPFARRPTYPDDRPPTGASSRPTAERENTTEMMKGMPGGMPQTPSGRDDYVMVDKGNR